MSMTDEEIERENNKWYERAVRDNRTYPENQEALRNKYVPILDAVRRWIPPTEEHERLKEFAIEQIVSCMPDTTVKIYSEEKCSNEQWLENSLVGCLKDIAYYEEMAKEEKERCEKRNKWLKELRDSLATLDE